MNLQEYYNIVLEKLQNNEYKIIRKDASIPIPTIDIKNIHNEALNYMIFEYMEDFKDKRRGTMFDYFLKPKGIGKKTDIDFDFTTVTFDEFFEFMTSIKRL